MSFVTMLEWGTRGNGEVDAICKKKIADMQNRLSVVMGTTGITLTQLFTSLLDVFFCHDLMTPFYTNKNRSIY